MSNLEKNSLVVAYCTIVSKICSINCGHPHRRFFCLAGGLYFWVFMCFLPFLGCDNLTFNQVKWLLFICFLPLYMQVFFLAINTILEHNGIYPREYVVKKRKIKRK